MKRENVLPINAFYITWLRDKGKKDRPIARWANKRSGEIAEKTEMDQIDFIMYMMLLSRADVKTLICFPSIETICKDCFGIERRTAWRHLSELEQMGFIKITKERGKPNRYFMLDFAEWKKNPHY